MNSRHNAELIDPPLPLVCAALSTSEAQMPRKLKRKDTALTTCEEQGVQKVPRRVKPCGASSVRSVASHSPHKIPAYPAAVLHVTLVRSALSKRHVSGFKHGYIAVSAASGRGGPGMHVSELGQLALEIHSVEVDTEQVPFVACQKSARWPRPSFSGGLIVATPVLSHVTCQCKMDNTSEHPREQRSVQNVTLQNLDGLRAWGTLGTRSYRTRLRTFPACILCKCWPRSSVT